MKGVAISDAQVEFGLSDFQRLPDLPSYEEVRSADELRNAAAVHRRLSRLDWSFTDDDTQYLSHDVHPYPAKFIPQLPGTLIASLSLRGEVVLDPFGGCGTTALEAARLGRRAISVDANPLAALVGRTKTCRLTPDDCKDIGSISSALNAKLASLPADPNELLEEFANHVPTIPNVEKWFPATSRGELALIRSHIDRIESDTARDVCLVALSRVILKASFQDSETRYASKPRDIPSGFALESFLRSLRAVTQSVQATASELQFGLAHFHTMDSRCLEREILPDASVALVVTSPPYGNAMDYPRIFDANREVIKNADRIYPGQKIRIPLG